MARTRLPYTGSNVNGRHKRYYASSLTAAGHLSGSKTFIGKLPKPYDVAWLGGRKKFHFNPNYALYTGWPCALHPLVPYSDKLNTNKQSPTFIARNASTSSFRRLAKRLEGSIHKKKRLAGLLTYHPCAGGLVPKCLGNVDATFPSDQPAWKLVWKDTDELKPSSARLLFCYSVPFWFK